MSNRISWALQRALGLSDADVRQVEIRADRIEESCRLDGAREYVPETVAYASRLYYGRKTLAMLGMSMPTE